MTMVRTMVRHGRRSMMGACLALILSLIAHLAWAEDAPGTFRTLCYHDVRDKLRETQADQPDVYAVDTLDLARQFSWLRENGYVPVSLDQIVAARSGGAPLPDHAVLLTFDDGLKSAYTKVFPLLKLFNYPAVIGLVTEWMEAPADKPVEYGDRRLGREAFISWDEAREMATSGLVEVASHSHDLHRAIIANPQGGQMPAAVTRLYEGAQKGYESEAAYEVRMARDMRTSGDIIARHVGKRPRAIIWPYGEFNRLGLEQANRAGMPITMNLQPGSNPPQQPLNQIRRTLVRYNTSLSDFIAALRQPATYSGVDRPLERVVHVDLDYVYDTDPVQQEANLGRLLDRIVDLHPSTVYLQAFADPQGTGAASALYFPNRHMPMRADLFSRAAWQLRTRAKVRVYAWMPVLAFALPAGNPVVGRLIKSETGGKDSSTEERYHRLTPFNGDVRALIRDIYEDLGRSARFAGVLFHDDATIGEDEDASPDALAYYKREWGLADGVAAIRANPQTAQRWAGLKTDFLDRFTLELADILRAHQPGLLTSRNLYADTALDASAATRYAQSFEQALKIYDFTALMAMPYLEGAADPTAWLDKLLERVKAVPGALPRTVFELQSRDWRVKEDVPSSTLAGQMMQLKRGGARNFGYYPDDFSRNHPAPEVVKPALSLENLYRTR